MSKYTKGPWTWEEDWLYGKDDGYTVEVLEAYFPDENELFAENKALIAAAPDLLEALIALRDACMGMVPDCADQVDNVISKALGTNTKHQKYRADE